MGYTHYWSQKKTFTRAEWAQVTGNMARIVLQAQHDGIKIGDNFGEVELIGALLDENPETESVGFNGFGEDSYETFIIQRTRVKDCATFCKTDRRPYDAAVTACLCYLESIYPANIGAESDGRADDWQAGLDLARRALPELAHLIELPPVVVFDSLISRNHFSGGGMALSTLTDGTLCITDHRALQVVGVFRTAEAVEWVKAWVERTAKERQAKLPARLDVLDRWQARKMRDFIAGAEICEYLDKAK